MHPLEDGVDLDINEPGLIHPSTMIRSFFSSDIIVNFGGKSGRYLSRELKPLITYIVKTKITEHQVTGVCIGQTWDSLSQKDEAFRTFYLIIPSSLLTSTQSKNMTSLSSCCWYCIRLTKPWQSVAGPIEIIPQIPSVTSCGICAVFQGSRRSHFCPIIRKSHSRSATYLETKKLITLTAF